MKDIFNVNRLDGGLVLNGEKRGNIYSFSITNTSGSDQKIGDITLLTANMIFSSDTKFYGEGYNMLSQYGGTIRDFKLLGSFSDYDHYRFERPEGFNQVYNMAIFFPKGEEPMLVGFSSCNRFNGWIRFNESEIRIALNCEGIVIKAGETVQLEEVFVERGERNSVLNSFARAISKNHPKQ